MSIKIGADWEGGFFDGGEFVGASEMPFRGDGHFGKDGASDTLEFRLLPFESAEEGCANFREVLTVAAASLKEARELDLMIASEDVPFGGHIHFSGVDAGIISPLQLAVGMPIRAATPASWWRGRLEDGYGEWGAFREQPHGWEWRAPGGFYGNPEVCLATLDAVIKIANMNSQSIRAKANEFIAKQGDLHEGGLSGLWNCCGCGGPETWREVLVRMLKEDLFGDVVRPLLKVYAANDPLPAGPLMKTWAIDPKSIQSKRTRRARSLRRFAELVGRQDYDPGKAWPTHDEVVSTKCKHKIHLTEEAEDLDE